MEGGTKMNHTYEERFWQRLGEALRTGWACLLVGVTLEYVPAVKTLMVVSVLSYVIAVLVSGPTLGTILRNALGLVAVAVPSLLSTLVVLQLLRPPISKLTAFACIGISSFFITFLSNTNLLGRKSALAQVSIVYIYAHYEEDMNVLTFPLRMMGPDILGASMAIVATLVPFPRLAVWEVCKSAKAGARGTSEVFQSAVNAFSVANASTFVSMYLHWKMLAQASTDIMTGIKAKQANLAWEFGASSRTRPALKRTAKVLAALNQHLAGMGMAMESGHFLNAPASLRSSLRGPLEKVVTISKSLVEYGVKLGTSKKFELQSNEAKVRKHLLIEEARGTLDAFDKHLSDARRTAFYQSTGCDSNDGSPAEILSGIEDGGIPWIDHQKAVESGYVTRKFRGRVSSYFFLFNMKLYLSEALNLVQLDSGSQTAIKMHHIARFQFGPSMADLEQSIHGRNSASTAEFLPSAAAAAAADDEKRGHQPNDDDDSPPPEAPRKESGARSSTSSFEFGTARRRSAGIFSEVHTFEAVEDQKKPPVLRRQCSHRHGSINSKLKKSSTATTEPIDSDKGTSAFAWRITSGVCQYLSKWGATRAQARRSLKIALSMVVTATFGTMIGSKQEDAFWATVTVGFIIGNYQGGSWRIANLRLQGTVLGGIYGYLALTLTRNHVWANLVALIPWVVLSSFVRYSPAYGYSGLVSAFTAAILILGDFEHDIRKYAMDRITETFVGVLAFVFVETVVFPERAVRLVRNELVSSLSGLRDCVAAIVVVYCGYPRNQAVGAAASSKFQETERSACRGLSGTRYLVRALSRRSLL